MRKGAILGSLVSGVKQAWIWALAAEFFVLMRLQTLLPVGRLRFVVAGRAFLIGMAACEMEKEMRERSC
jgi:hypothetical protein